MPESVVHCDGGAAVRHAVVVQVFAHAADAVAAHFTLRTVGVKNAHLRIRLVRRGDQNDAVAADAEMRLAQPDRKFLGIGDRLVKTVEIDVVVAAAVHLGEGQLHAVSLLEINKKWYMSGGFDRPSLIYHIVYHISAEIALLNSKKRKNFAAAGRVPWAVSHKNAGFQPGVSPFMIASAIWRLVRRCFMACCSI